MENSRTLCVSRFNICACILHIVSSNSDLEDSRTLCVSGFIEAAECFFCALLFSFSAPTVLRTHTGPYVSRFQLV